MIQPVSDKLDVLDVLGRHRDQIASFGARRLGLFGSYVRGEHGPDSDVDLLVEFDPVRKTFDNFMQLSFFLEEILQRRVELVTTESLSPYIGPQILREAEYVQLAG
jgi:uncharacterized protein